jgi:2-octaprenyl-6-methoxyphenol hydroxylase
MALVGDAAHMIHPLAGQGVNLAFRDIAALVDSIAETLRDGADIGSDACLADYERARYFETTSMVAATHGLNGLFSNDSPTLRVLRDFGMNIVQRLPQLKRRLIKEAAGINDQAPTLLRGELP